jgi:nucleotide-binding universal stress UspA family protein
MISKVLVPIDGSPEATAALEYALAVHGDAEITVLYVAGEASPMMGEAMGIAIDSDTQAAASEEGEEVFEAARELAAEAGVGIETAVGVGKPGDVIVKHAGNYDLIVVGSHSGSFTETLLSGNVTKQVVRGSSVPVTVVK